MLPAPSQMLSEQIDNAKTLPYSSSSSSSRLLGLRILVQAGLLMVAILALRQQQVQMQRQTNAAIHLQDLQEASVVPTNNEEVGKLEKLVRQLKEEKESLERRLQGTNGSTFSSTTTKNNVNDEHTQLQLELQKVKDANEELKEKLEQAIAATTNDAAANNDENDMKEQEQHTTTNSENVSLPPPTPLVHSNLKLQLGTKELRQEQNYTSPACTLQVDDDQVFNRIVFLHQRKAGGTSARDYFKHVAMKNKVPFLVMEGFKAVELPTFDNKTLYVTHVREPISRVLSHYKYEQRWDCKEQLQHPNVTISLDNQKLTIEQFVEKEFYHRSKFWSCSQECLLRWSTSCYQKDCLDPNSDMEERGRKTLGQYHLMLVSEWLQDPDYSASLEAIFGIPKINRKNSMHCGDKAAEANQKFPVQLTPQVLNTMTTNNQRDIRMYKDFTQCPHGPQFWGRTIKFEPYSVPKGEKPLRANVYRPPLEGVDWSQWKAKKERPE